MYSSFSPGFFDRVDENDDANFYSIPRLVVHIDKYAIAQIGKILGEVLPLNPRILDLLSSWRSHLPPRLTKCHMVGLGMNFLEMSENPALNSYVVQNVNKNSTLPFEDETFDAVLLTVSVQYIVRPIEVFREVNRVLTENGAFIVTFSNRMFPTKAIKAWQLYTDQQRMTLIKFYLQKAGGYKGIIAEDRSPTLGYYTDPVYLVMARKDSREPTRVDPGT